jgi:hypothetical protein
MSYAMASVLGLALSTLVARGAAWGQLQATADLPEPLRPWVGWVLHGHEDDRCPLLFGLPDRHQCLWPSRLILELRERAGRFNQQWRVDRDAWVPLPGDTRLWPQHVQVDGHAAVVTPQAGRPVVHLERGTHAAEGVFEWDDLPEFLQVPPETGLLALSIRGEAVAFPSRDAEGRLWLNKRGDGPDVEDRVDVSVQRRVTDDVPLVLTTRVELNVSGKERELRLGKALPEKFIPMSLASPIPARLESDGHLRVQVRPGNWSIELVARHDGPASALHLPASDSAADGTWDAAEVWVFEARNDLRIVSVEGVAAVDPQQTLLPEEWKRWPAYRMRPGDTMTLLEKRRGGGYTIHDQISGTVSRSWRLDMSPPTSLGRVAIAGQDQLITRLGDTPDSGVEIRQVAVQVDADSRWAGSRSRLPAVGWRHDFHEVSGQLNLPPGWRLLHASGVDDVSTTWLGAWTLLDLFVVLIIAMAAAKLWGWAVGGLALVTLGLTYTEPNAPRLVWLCVLTAEALVRGLPHGRLLRLAKVGRVLAATALLVITIPFMVQQVRHGMYPALEHPGLAMAERKVPGVPAEAARPKSMRQADQFGAADQMAEEHEVRRAAVPPSPREVDLNALIQTGPGLPQWQWNAVSLRWRGPVERTQQMRLFLLPPWANFCLGLLRTGLLAVLLVCIVPSSSRDWWRRFAERRRMRTLPVAALLLVLSGLLIRSARADIPSADVLNQLRDRLLEKPECHPTCAASPRLRLDIRPTRLTAEMEVHAATETAIPLPGSAQHWTPDSIAVDGEPPAGLTRAAEGFLWLLLSPGTHRITLAGALPDRDVVHIALPLKPHRVEAHTEGWILDGLHEDGLADDTLQLTRVGADSGAAHEELQAGIMPPFVRVERELRLGLTWVADTTVQRLTPPDTAVVLEVPLLPGELVTTPGVRIADGRAQVNMAPPVSTVQWQSLLTQHPAISLRAPESVPWAEVWQVNASSLWHVESQGIPMIHRPDTGGTRVREWRPWPGEAVTIEVSRPAGVIGQALTIDRSLVEVSPGLRATDASLTLDLRSSRGGQHTVRLPEGAELQSVVIDGARQPIRQEQRAVTLPLVPGRQAVHLAWRQGGGIVLRFRSPEVDLGQASVNTETRIAVPADRWTLFLGGPRLGPAVLFWSSLIVLALVSVGLARLRFTPLGWHHWFLLGVGLTQVPIWSSVIIAGWLLALGWRRERGTALGDLGFNVFQLFLALWTVAALAELVWSVQQGLLGLPEMQIAGNGSSARQLRWYSDAAAAVLPRAWVLSVPLLVYRVAMLAWALWLAQALLRWLRWGWSCFTAGGISRPLRRTLPLREMRTTEP